MPVRSAAITGDRGQGSSLWAVSQMGEATDPKSLVRGSDHVLASVCGLSRSGLGSRF
jgi:hypothetical protein